VNTLSLGGAERVSLTIAELLHKAGCKVDFLVLEPVSKPYQVADYPFAVHTLQRIPRPFGYMYSLKVQQVKNHLKKQDTTYDLVLSNLYMSDYVARKLKIPNTYHCIHNSISQSLKLNPDEKVNVSWVKRFIIYKLFAKRIYNNSQIITVSNGVRTDFTNLRYFPKHIQTIYNPIDVKKVRILASQLQIDKGSYIIHVGRFDRQKRHDILIKAYARSKIQHKLMLVGDDNTHCGREARTLVQELGLNDCVVFIGLLTNPYPLIKNASALVLSSDYEGLPTVILEAIALQTPVISTDCPSGPKEILSGRLSEGLVKMQDIDALARKMQNIPNYIEADYLEPLSKFLPEFIARRYIKL
jgi:glycosyltransferase involved in cell wall biosynthesis